MSYHMDRLRAMLGTGIIERAREERRDQDSYSAIDIIHFSFNGRAGRYFEITSACDRWGAQVVWLDEVKLCEHKAWVGRVWGGNYGWCQICGEEIKEVEKGSGVWHADPCLCELCKTGGA